MIPKVIHYCWFGGNPLPKSAQKCIASWRKYLPDYEIKEWNESNFDIDLNSYTQMCYEQKNHGTSHLSECFRYVWMQQAKSDRE